MKKSLTFIFAAALLVSCQQEENETTTPSDSRDSNTTVRKRSRLLSHALPKLTLKPEIKLALQSSKTVTSYMRKIN